MRGKNERQEERNEMEERKGKYRKSNEVYGNSEAYERGEKGMKKGMKWREGRIKK